MNKRDSVEWQLMGPKIFDVIPKPRRLVVINSGIFYILLSFRT